MAVFRKGRREGQREIHRQDLGSVLKSGLGFGFNTKNSEHLLSVCPAWVPAQPQTPDVRYHMMLTAVLRNKSHHWPFEEGGEAEKVCDLPAVLQLVSAGLGCKPTRSGTHPCAQEDPPRPAAPRSWRL